MSELISRHYAMLLVMSRFGIGIGFGEKNIKEVCEENGVDTATFLAVVHALLERGDTSAEYEISLDSMLEYLHNSHNYFLDFRLPYIRTKLAEVLNNDNKELNKAVFNYFDEYVAEVRKHMEYEEKTVFPYIRDLMAGKRREGYTIETFSSQHDHVEARLTEFKNIIIKYYPAQSTNTINSVLFDIFSCERDLASHNDIEDRLLVPAIAKLESKN